VLTFGRAVSGDDYEAVAAQTPGVKRARVTWGWDPAAQRSLVKVFVGDDDAAVAAARAALRDFADPNRPVAVTRAEPVQADLAFTLVVAADYAPEPVKQAVAAALLDPRRQPFGAEVVRIGQTVYDSQIYDACLRVPGVVAVHGLAFGIWKPPALYALGLGLRAVATIRTGYFDSPEFDQAFGAHFDPAELYDPVILAYRLNLQSTEDLYDPEKIAGKVGRVVDVPDDEAGPAPGAAEPLEILYPQPGPRHSPGEGGFYLLRDDHLHIAVEAAHHVL
jgi:hypothetical protein